MDWTKHLFVCKRIKKRVGEAGGDWTCLSGETLAHKRSSKFSLVCLV